MLSPRSKTAGWLQAHPWARESGLYLGAVALCLIVLTGALRLWRADLRVPITYERDSLATLSMIKGLVENSWYLHNGRLGAPGAAELYGYPRSDNLQCAILKALSWPAPDAAVLFNLYFLLTFPLTTLAALFVFRHFKAAPGPALVGSLLFTFLPYHFLKGERGHLFEAAYYQTPLALLLLLWVYLDQGPFFRRDEATGRLRTRLWTLRSLAAVLAALVIASTGVYYAFFACALLPVAGLAACVRRKRVYPFGNAAALIAVLGLGVLANLAPSLIYKFQHPGGWQAVVRTPQQGETYGLKVVQLLLPVAGHRLPWLAELRTWYDGTALRVNDSGYSSLGFVGGLGFLALLGWFVFRRRAERGSPLYDALGLFTLCAVLLATVGGFGTVLSYSLAPWIRVYSRISVYLGLFSLFAVVLFLDGVRRRAGAGVKAWLFHALLAGLLVVGILDQVSPAVIPPYASLRAAYAGDAAFVRAVEGAVPHDAMIFQLPHVPYPEHPPVNRMKDYDLFRGYLHSQALRWSYGALRDQETSAWLDDVASRPPEELVRVLSLTGFSGVWVDRAGFADGGSNTEYCLAGLLGTQPLVSDDGRFAFFNMEEFNRRFRAQFNDQQWDERRRRALLPPVQLAWGTAFCAPEGEGRDAWRWCPEEGELSVVNACGQDRTVALEMHLEAGRGEPSGLRLRGDLISTDLTVTDRDQTVSRTVVVPPGKHSIHFACDGRRIDATPTDSRVRTFRVGNVSLRDAD